MTATDPRPTLGWSDLRGARVGVWGLGREGSASLRKLRALGVEPVLVDDNPTEPGIRATADGGLDALAGCEIVVKTPGISPYGPEAAASARPGSSWSAGSASGCRKPTGTGSSASPGPRASRPPRPSSATCWADSATRPWSAATSAPPRMTRSTRATTTTG